MPSCATRSHSTLPVRLSSAISFHECFDDVFRRLDVAVEAGADAGGRIAADRRRDEERDRPTRSGSSTATPAIGVFHSDVLAGRRRSISPRSATPSATPDAGGPRNDGQFCADSDSARREPDGGSTDDRGPAPHGYSSPLRVNTIVLPVAFSVIPMHLVLLDTERDVVPGCSAMPNVVGSRATSVRRALPPERRRRGARPRR